MGDTIFNVKWTQKNELIVLMIFHLLWGSVLWLSISKYGLGISTDSVHLLFGGLNLAEGKDLFSFDGSFLLSWPPLYPMLLAFIHILSGVNTFIAATILQIASFMGISICLSLLFMKVFPDNFWLVLAANILSDIGAVSLTAFDIVGSDYVHFFLVIIFILLAGYYIERKTPLILLGMVIIGMLAMLQRYLGIVAIATGVTVVFFFGPLGVKQRLIRGFLMALSALPAIVWLWITSKLTDQRAPVSFTDNFTWFSRSILEWFFPTDALQPHLFLYIVALWILIIGMVAMLFFYSWGRNSLSIFTIPVFGYGLFYLFILFGSASITYFNKLGGRFLLPLYVPLVTLLASAFDVSFKWESRLGSKSMRRVTRIGLMGTLAVIAGGLLQITVPLAVQSYGRGAAGENAYNNRAWHANSVMEYWLENQPRGDYLLFSNDPDGIAFYTWHSCFNSPSQYSGPYGKEQTPVMQYAPELFSSGLDVYLIWVEPKNSDTYYYNPEDLSPIAQVEPLFVSQDGGVYRLMPRLDAGP